MGDIRHPGKQMVDALVSSIMQNFIHYSFINCIKLNKNRLDEFAKKKNIKYLFKKTCYFRGYSEGYSSILLNSIYLE